jgi:uncharacterized protein RhaS with RHS repeats
VDFADPATGQFTQEDPIGLDGGGAVYGYGSGDPLNRWDPFGLSDCEKADPRPECRRVVHAEPSVVTGRPRRASEPLSPWATPSSNPQSLYAAANAVEPSRARRQMPWDKSVEETGGCSFGGVLTAGMVTASRDLLRGLVLGAVTGAVTGAVIGGPLRLGSGHYRGLLSVHRSVQHWERKLGSTAGSTWELPTDSGTA